mgnify:CR=1 FL=1
MKQFIKNNGSLIEDKYSLPYNVADNNIPTDQGMEIDSFDGIFYRNPSATWITSKELVKNWQTFGRGGLRNPQNK